jgi:hypothetical protein
MEEPVWGYASRSQVMMPHSLRVRPLYAREDGVARGLLVDLLPSLHLSLRLLSHLCYLLLALGFRRDSEDLSHVVSKYHPPTMFTKICRTAFTSDRLIKELIFPCVVPNSGCSPCHPRHPHGSSLDLIALTID